MRIITKIVDTVKDIGRPVLSDRTIMKYNKKGLLIEQTINPEQLQPNSVDLTLGNSVKLIYPNYNGLDPDTYKHTAQCIDTSRKQDYVEFEFKPFAREFSKKSGYVLPPRRFVLMASKEILHIPNGILSFVQGRSSIARLGIQTEQAGLIDAGFRGTITFEVYNQTDWPIILYEGMRIAQVYFFKAQHAKSLYAAKDKFSKYQDQIQATGSMIHNDPEFRRDK